LKILKPVWTPRMPGKSAYRRHTEIPLESTTPHPADIIDCWEKADYSAAVLPPATENSLTPGRISI
jgi:hypothetical protein